MPLLAFTDELDGKLSAPSMLVAWCTSTVLLCLAPLAGAADAPAGDAMLTRAEAIGHGVLVGSISAGSVVLFLASMPFVYHEAYSWAIATSLGAAYCMLGFLQRPTTKALVGASIFTLGAVLCRTTAGWACAGALLLIALWCLVRRPHDVPAPLDRSPRGSPPSSPCRWASRSTGRSSATRTCSRSRTRCGPG